MGKTGRLNLEMNDWMGNQNKKREKLTDSDILKQFEQAEKDTRFLPINPPPKDEFDQIWSRIQAEQALFSEISNTTNTKSSRKTRRRPVRKALVVGLAAAIMVIGGCFVAMGTKSYFYRDGRSVNQGVVYNNDSGALTVRSEEEAYEKIAEELGVKTLKLGYMPEGMRFQDVTIGIGYGKLRYEYKNERITFIQAKSSLKTSMMYSSDTEEGYKIWNSGLHADIEVRTEDVDTNDKGYEAQFVYNGVYYYISAIMNQEEFDKMILKFTFKNWRLYEKISTLGCMLFSYSQCICCNCICRNTASGSIYFYRSKI